MKKMIIGVALCVGLYACNGNAKKVAVNQTHAIEKQQMIAAIKDSLRLDSFERAQAQKASQSVKQEAATRIDASQDHATGSHTSPNRETTTKKQGWSYAAKDAALGGLAGAIGGAIIDKKKGRGAVVGGMVGAGTGYVIGREKDKKTGRVQP